MEKPATDGAAIRASLDDPTRFELVFDRHFDTVYRYLARRIGPDAASDLAAETFAVAFRRRVDYDSARADAGPWLYGIAANLLRSWRRREERMLRAYARTGADPAGITEHPAGPQVADALAALEPADRETLLLYAWADLSYEQIAEALGVPVGTVRSRLHRARARVRTALTHDEVEQQAAEVLDG